MLGGSGYDSPLYPSMSVIDWAGNSHHLRLGGSREAVIKYTEKVQRPKDPQQKSKEVLFDDVERTVHCQDVAEPILPPLSQVAAETDVIAQIGVMVEERENEVLKQIA